MEIKIWKPIGPIAGFAWIIFLSFIPFPAPGMLGAETRAIQSPLEPSLEDSLLMLSRPEESAAQAGGVSLRSGHTLVNSSGFLFLHCRLTSWITLFALMRPLRPNLIYTPWRLISCVI